MPNQLDLFQNQPSPEARPERDEELINHLRHGTGLLARHGIHIGTSSWKYPGWCGLLYQEGRYQWRGRFAESRFNRDCLAEYAEVFRSVCVDGAYYQFPAEECLTGLASQVPDDFRFSFKVTEEITLKRHPNIQRMGDRAGRENPDFLNADLFDRRFLRPLQSIRSQTGLLMFEFSRFSPHDFRHGHEFLDLLDRFLGDLPTGWDYAVEIRNEEFLEDAYLDVLKRRGVGHVFNSWEAMPPIERQMETVGDHLDAGPAGARFLLRPGRKYQQAVDRFSPYRVIREVYEAGREAGARLIAHAMQRKQRLYLYGNNRLEGCSPVTLAEMLKRIPADAWRKLETDASNNSG